VNNVVRTEDCAAFQGVAHGFEFRAGAFAEEFQGAGRAGGGPFVAAVEFGGEGFPRASAVPTFDIHAIVAVFAQPTALPQFLKPTRQPLADALGVVVGGVVVRRGGHGGSSPEFVEHELLLGGG
jgi:hypothetical protein